MPCIEDPAYVRGLTDRQHKLARSFAEERKKETVLSVAKLRTACDDLRSQALKDSKSKQLKVRGRAFLAKYAFRGVPIQALVAASPAAHSVPLLPKGAASHGLPQPTPSPTSTPMPMTAAAQPSTASSKPTKFALMMEEARAAQARANA